MIVACFKYVRKIYDSGYKSNQSNKLVSFNYMIKKITIVNGLDFKKMIMITYTKKKYLPKKKIMQLISYPTQC